MAAERQVLDWNSSNEIASKSCQSLCRALHVALATVAAADMILSWNFRHIVHFEKSRLYSAVNVLNGYEEIAIHSPLEVTGGEDEDV